MLESHSALHTNMKQFHIGKSSIAGRGILASEDIKKGEFIMWLRGKKVYRNYKKKSDFQNEMTWCPVGINWWVNPGFPIKFLNHSCNPSAGFKTPRRMYAIRDIPKGEEITVDYSTIEYVTLWDIPCHCKAHNCRKVVRAIQFLPNQIYKVYLPYIPRFLQRVYSQQKRTV